MAGFGGALFGQLDHRVHRGVEGLGRYSVKCQSIINQVSSMISKVHTCMYAYGTNPAQYKPNLRRGHSK